MCPPKQLPGWGISLVSLKIGLVIYPRSEYSCPMKSNIGNTVIETESFMKQAAALWSASELDDLKEK